MKYVNATTFKSQCLALIDEVHQTGEPIVITKRGRRLAQLAPISVRARLSPQASLRGSGVALDDLVEPAIPPGAWDAGKRRRKTR